jgi:hypothetical protein
VFEMADGSLSCEGPFCGLGGGAGDELGPRFPVPKNALRAASNGSSVIGLPTFISVPLGETDMLEGSTCRHSALCRDSCRGEVLDVNLHRRGVLT